MLALGLPSNQLILEYVMRARQMIMIVTAGEARVWIGCTLENSCDGILIMFLN